MTPPERTDPRYPPRSMDARLIEEANRAYHEAEASLYDVSHPEILWCERPHWTAFSRDVFGVAGRVPASILDIGAGTGFIGGVFRPFLRAGDRYVATDLSPEMLEKLQEAMMSAPCEVQALVAPADHQPFPDGQFTVVTINSALHHFPDPEAALREAARVLVPGGLLAIMHEPNIRFMRSWLLRQVARAASYAAWKLDGPTGAAPRPDYAPVFALVNRRLMDAGLVAAPISPSEIQALVDVHSPTARGGLEELGFDPFAWVKDGPFAGWERRTLVTYNFLGKVDPTARTWRRFVEHGLKTVLPRSGYQFSLVVRKPAV